MMRTARPTADKRGPSRKALPQRAKQNVFVAQLLSWGRGDGLWWFSSFAFHAMVVVALALIGRQVVVHIVDEAPSFDAPPLAPLAAPQDIERFELGNAPLDPTALDTESLTLEPPGQEAQKDLFYDNSPVFKEATGGGMATADAAVNLGGLGGFDLKGLGSGPSVLGKGGVGAGVGTSNRPGSGGEGTGFGSRGAGFRKALLGSGGGTRQSERAVAAALNWIARHQLPTGNWSMKYFPRCCKGEPCTGAGSIDQDSAATALGLLPFLAAGQTHESKGPYKRTIQAGIVWLLQNQKPDGDLRVNGNMYAHGLASIALCECYGMTGNKQVGRAAQAALDFIAAAQDPEGGGWRYKPRPKGGGDTSVTGWQVMALKSGQMAGLRVDPMVLDRAKNFLRTVAYESLSSGRFTYQPKGVVVNNDRATTAVGLLCEQYMYMPRNDPTIAEGVRYLMQHQPDPQGKDGHDIYYWYYATQVLHNLPGPDWDAWNRRIRRLLIDTQVRDGCAAGSWDPFADKLHPRDRGNDAWGHYGGRLMMTSLSALTLEVYYRYLPLYKLNNEALDQMPGLPAMGKAAEENPQPAAEPAPAVKSGDAPTEAKTEAKTTPADGPKTEKSTKPPPAEKPPK